MTEFWFVCDVVSRYSNSRILIPKCGNIPTSKQMLSRACSKPTERCRV